MATTSRIIKVFVRDLIDNDTCLSDIEIDQNYQNDSGNITAEQGSFVECTEEGPVAYIDTWYVHHQRQRHCRNARPFRLQGDPATWKDDILDLWTDILDPTIATTIHLVRPTPPCAMTECVLAHLILEQSERPQQLITSHASNHHGDSTEHTAYSLPDMMTAHRYYALRRCMPSAKRDFVQSRSGHCLSVTMIGKKFLALLD